MELGAGLGLVSIMSALSGAAQVIATDGDQARISHAGQGGGDFEKKREKRECRVRRERECERVRE